MLIYYERINVFKRERDREREREREMKGREK
jgi:hypothetical protein